MSLDDKIQIAFQLLSLADKKDYDNYAKFVPGLPYRELTKPDGEKLRIMFMDMKNPG